MGNNAFHTDRMLNRREFMLQATVVTSSALVVSCSNVATTVANDNSANHPQGFQLPPLGYDYKALEPYIDAQTMQLHYDKHHATYVNNLNDALKNHPLATRPVEEVLRRLNELPENIRTAVRNNGGGHANHTMFWQIMAPGGSKQPAGDLASAINTAFGSFNTFKTAFNDVGAKRFGSGWVWLYLDKNSKLTIASAPNQDSPFMEGLLPILGNDVWEHAYYLKYQNRRADYLNAWWNVVNWDVVARRYMQAKKP